MQDGSLALPSSLHSEVALLVADAYQKYLTDKPYSGLISEGIKQVTDPPVNHRQYASYSKMTLLFFHLSFAFYLRCLTLPVSFVWEYLLKRPLTSGHGNCC